jgi:hypothetical protein
MVTVCYVRVCLPGNLVTESLSIKRRPLWLRYSGFQAARHNIYFPFLGYNNYRKWFPPAYWQTSTRLFLFANRGNKWIRRMSSPTAIFNALDFVPFDSCTDVIWCECECNCFLRILRVLPHEAPVSSGNLWALTLRMRRVIDFTVLVPSDCYQTTDTLCNLRVCTSKLTK